MTLQRYEILELHKKNAGRICYIEPLCANDERMVLRNEVETLHCFMSSERDLDEQAQAARLCSAINADREQFISNAPSGSLIPHVIDGGGTTLRGLSDRCSMFDAIHGPGKISNHEDGFIYESESGYRIVVTLLANGGHEP